MATVLAVHLDHVAFLQRVVSLHGLSVEGGGAPELYNIIAAWGFFHNAIVSFDHSLCPRGLVFGQ